jgi:hypothetical protein
VKSRQLFLLTTIGLLVLVNCVVASAQSRCTNRMTKGAYAFVCTGTLILPPVAPATSSTTPPVAFAMIGRAVSDGTGHWEGTAMADIGGMFMPEFLTTTGGSDAELNQDCTGTITYKQWSANPQVDGGAIDLGPLPINFVVSDNGNEIDGLPTGSGATITCRLIRQFN